VQSIINKLLNNKIERKKNKQEKSIKGPILMDQIEEKKQ